MMNLKIITPERIVYEDSVQQVTVPTQDGVITVLPQHMALVGVVTSGELLIKQDNKEVPMAISGGFVQVNDDGAVILADTAERVEEIIEARAEEARARAQALLAEKHVSDTDYAALAGKIEKELARLHVVRKYRHRGHGGLASDISKIQE